ncbi:MAG: hypothetical protein QOD58_4548 [Mycobacterium sp.]|nr:hypothetical protein [Mycobacterium sp.]
MSINSSLGSPRLTRATADSRPVNLRRENRLPSVDVVIKLDTADELFAADPRGLLTGGCRIDSGMDELVERLLAQKKILAEQRIVLDIAEECSDEMAANVVAAVRRYCELRLRRADREHDLVWRQGKRSLLSGSLLFAAGIALSYTFTRPAMGEPANDLLGNGVFLVVAWVGLWYPLDLLFIAREQAKREVRVLDRMRTVPVVVRVRDSALPAAPVPGAPAPPCPPPSLNTRFRRFRGPSSAHL